MPNEDILTPPAAMTSLLRRNNNVDPAPAPAPVLAPARLAVLTRADQALHRIDQLSAALEKAADDMEKQLALVKTRL